MTYDILIYATADTNDPMSWNGKMIAFPFHRFGREPIDRQCAGRAGTGPHRAVQAPAFLALWKAAGPAQGRGQAQ